MQREDSLFGGRENSAANIPLRVLQRPSVRGGRTPKRDNDLLEPWPDADDKSCRSILSPFRMTGYILGWGELLWLLVQQWERRIIGVWSRTMHREALHLSRSAGLRLSAEVPNVV